MKRKATIKKLLVTLTILASFSAIAGRETDGENGYWQEGDIFEVPSIQLGEIDINLLNMKKVYTLNKYTICNDDGKASDIKILNTYINSAYNNKNEPTPLYDLYIIETQDYITYGSYQKVFYGIRVVSK